MATTQTAIRPAEVKLEYGVPQIVAFKFLQAKAFENNFGTRALFTLADDRRMWLDAEDGSEIERNLRELGVQRGELVRLTKVKFPRGGGHAVRVERVAESYAEPAGDDTAAQLEKSIAIARTEGPQAFRRNAHVLPAAAAASPEVQTTAAGARDASHDNPLAARMMAALKIAIDATIEATAYAARKGMNLAFTEESIRALAATVYINNAREGR